MDIKLECFSGSGNLKAVAWVKACFIVASTFFWGVPHLSGIESSCPFKFSYKGLTIRPKLGIQILQYPISPRQACNCFWVVGEGNWRIPCTQSQDSLLDLCVIWTPRLVTCVSTIYALAWETLYPLSAKKFRTWIACFWAFFSSGEQISRSSKYCNIFPIRSQVQI